MKFKRILPICLLAGSLLLSSCDDLLNNLTGGKKNKDDDSQLRGYQGKQGATELSKAEWEQAFSLEEFALRRNCHVEVSQGEMSISMDVDNGKFKIIPPYQQTTAVYFEFDSVDAEKNISGTGYAVGDNGTYVASSDKEPLDLVMGELGIMYLEYDSFKYNSSSKMYTANNYHYEVVYNGQKAIDIDCSDYKVTIEDGFPKKLECDITLGDEDDEMTTHYVANYSRYNAITVDLPNTGNNNNGSSNNNGGNNGLPAINGKEINFSQFKSAYQAKATPNYNTAVLTVTINDGATMNQTVTISATKVNGEWVMDDANYESIDLESMLITDEMMAELETEVNDPQYDIHFYQKSNGYVVAMSQQYVADSETGKMETIDVQLHLDQYFYTTAEYLYSSGVYEGIEIQWRA